MLQVRVTSLTLLAATALGDRLVVRSLLVANSLVGLAYTYVEEDAIVEDGVCLLGWTALRPSRAAIRTLNVLLHVVLPLLQLLYFRPSLWREPVSALVATLVVGYALLDIRCLYPTRVYPLETYAICHAAVAVTALVLMNSLAPRYR